MLMKRKSVSVLLAAALLASVLFGCGNSGGSQNADDSSTQTSQEDTGSEVEKTQEDTADAGSEDAAAENAGADNGAESNPEDLTGTVVIWDWDGGTQQKYVDKFNEVYPNVTIEVQDVAWDDYMTKLQTSYVSGMELPDIIGIYGATAPIIPYFRSLLQGLYNSCRKASV